MKRGMLSHTTLRPYIRLFSNAKAAFDGKLDPFGRQEQAVYYALYRPRYSDQLIQDLIKPLKSNELFVDVACGSGQLTTRVAKYFKKSVGIDKSFEQLNQAGKNEDNIEYIAGSAFDLPVKSNSVDLLTIAQAFHWITPHEKLFPEIDRVMKPGGLFAIIGYAIPYCTNPTIEKVFRGYYENTLGSLKRPGEPGCQWDIPRPDVDSGFAQHQFPWPIQRQQFPDTVNMPIKHFIGFLKSQSGYKNLMASSPVDPLIQLQRDIIVAASTTANKADENTIMQIVIPYYALTYQKK